MPGFFWPTKFNDIQTRKARFGRAAHFFGAACMVPATMVGLLATGSAVTQAMDGRWDGVAFVLPWALMWFALAPACYLVGRALRYICAGE